MAEKQPSTPKKGDLYVYDPDPDKPLFIQVTRVAKDGSWADCNVLNWACCWTKRQPTPIPGRRHDWTMDEVNSYIPAEVA